MTTSILDRMHESLHTLTRAQANVADYIVRNYKEVSFMTIEQVSRNVGTSTTTIMRFASSLGYAGYSDMQRDLQELLLAERAPYNKFIDSMSEMSANDLMVKCAEYQVENIRKTMELVDEKQLAAASSSIAGAHNVYIMGLRTSYCIAVWLYQLLQRQLDSCHLLASGNEDFPEKLSQMGKNDVLIGISLPRYRTKVPHVMRTAHEYGVTTVAITDGYRSPLAKHADYILPISHSSISFFNSVGGGIFMAEYLASAIAVSNSERTAERLKQLEATIRKMDL